MLDLERAFQTLNVSPCEDMAIIRKAWRALVRTYHPDMSKTDPVAANNRLAEINSAYDAVISCTSEDIKNLRRLIKERARRAARARQEDLWKRQKAREAHVQAQQKLRRNSEKDKTKDKPAAPCPEQTTAVVAEPRARSRRVVHPPYPSQSAFPDPVSGVVEQAVRGFSEAKHVCSRFAPRQKRSVYL